MLALPIMHCNIFSFNISTIWFLQQYTYVYEYTIQYLYIHLPEYVSKRTPFLNRCRWNISLSQLSFFFLLLQMYVISPIFTLIQYILLLAEKVHIASSQTLTYWSKNRHSIIFQKCKYSGGEISTLTPKKNVYLLAAVEVLRNLLHAPLCAFKP